jgi:zinc transport system substrate-binding protein
VTTVIEGTGAATGVLDPVGAELPAGPESYFHLLNALADDLVAGLRQENPGIFK